MHKSTAEKNHIHEIMIATDKIKVFRDIPVNEQGFVLLNISKTIRERIINKLKSIEIINLMHYLDPDDSTDLLQNIKSERRRNNIIEKLSADIKDKVEYLLKFDPASAAGIMSLDYIEVSCETTFHEVAKIIRKHEVRTGKLPAILVVHEGLLHGELLMHDLGLYPKEEDVSKHIRKIPAIQYNQGESDIISLFKKNPHTKIVVLDEDRSIMGVIYSDDILKLIQKQTSNTLYDFAGVSREEDVLDSALTKVKYRYKWLILNLGTAFLAASVIGLFSDTLTAVILLAAYMPIVAGMGGNAGTQAMAVIVRGLTLKEIELKTSKRVILNEMVAGCINGAITGLLVALIATFVNKSPMLGLVVGAAMVFNLVIAGLFGALVPVLMKQFGKDPATSATIFITTATDVLGFLVFLGLATIVLV
ncbi:MAG: magnesium transporter [Nanohaloarchaea archaeon]|nr:magnesium transporter [Candidatus Nanohaloarchaea archaeon]